MIEIPLKRTHEFATNPVHIIGAADIEAYRVQFPNIDIETELAEIAGYCKANPTKRWTAKGVERAIHANLRNKNDRAVSRAVGANAKPQQAAAAHPAQTGIPDYGNYMCTWELGERMIEALWNELPFIAPEHLSEYRPKFNLRRLIEKIVADCKEERRAIGTAFGNFNRFLSSNWERIAAKEKS